MVGLLFFFELLYYFMLAFLFHIASVIRISISIAVFRFITGFNILGTALQADGLAFWALRHYMFT